MPTVSAVIKTPIVEREMPRQRMDLMFFMSVSSPPENKIKFRAVTPINWARWASSK